MIQTDGEIYTMFLDWKNQHCENDSTTQSNQQIQCNPYQATNCIFHRTRIKNFKICMETQKTPNSQNNLEKEWSWRNQAPRLQTVQQSYTNQDTMVPAQKQKYRSMEQNRKPRSKPSRRWSNDLQQRCQGYTVGKAQSSTNGAGKTGSPQAKE